VYPPNSCKTLATSCNSNANCCSNHCSASGLCE
jgi:hypothetical protein